MIQTLLLLYERDLGRLRAEIEAYEADETIWRVDGEIANSAGNLCLHLLGNLNTYIGNIIGGSNYVRRREQEFSLKGIPRSELLQMIENTRDVVRSSLQGISVEDLQKEYPLLVFESKTTMEYLLVHLATHLAYHLGQINYHRRLIG